MPATSCDYCGWIANDGAILVECPATGKFACQNCRDADDLYVIVAPMDLPIRVVVVETRAEADFEFKSSRYDLVGFPSFWAIIQAQILSDHRYYFSVQTGTPHEGAEAIKTQLKEILKTRPGTLSVFLRSDALRPWFFKSPAS